MKYNPKEWVFVRDNKDEPEIDQEIILHHGRTRDLEGLKKAILKCRCGCSIFIFTGTRNGFFCFKCSDCEKEISDWNQCYWKPAKNIK